MRFISFTGEPVTAQLPEPSSVTFADTDDFIIDDDLWSVAFDEHGDAWQVTFLDDPEESFGYFRVVLPCLIGPRPR